MLPDSVPLSQALPQDDSQDLKPGVELAITGIMIVPREKKGQNGTVDTWDSARINGVSLPDGDVFVKYRTSASVVVKKCKDLIAHAGYPDGRMKKPVRVRVVERAGNHGAYLDLEDA